MLAAFSARKAAEVTGALEGIRAELQAGREGMRAGFDAVSQAAVSVCDVLKARLCL